MSQSAPRSFSESIHGIARCRCAQIGLERITIDYIDRGFEKTRHILLEADVVVDGPFGAGFELHQNVDIAVGPFLAACDGTEERRARATPVQLLSIEQ